MSDAEFIAAAERQLAESAALRARIRRKLARKRRPNLAPRTLAFPALGPASAAIDELEREREKGRMHRGE